MLNKTLVKIALAIGISLSIFALVALATWSMSGFSDSSRLAQDQYRFDTYVHPWPPRPVK
jgi:hypothetical protein